MAPLRNHHTAAVFSALLGAGGCSGQDLGPLADSLADSPTDSHHSDSVPDSSPDSVLDSHSESKVPDSETDSKVHDSEGPPAPRCSPTGSVSPQWPLEGDTISVTFACTSGEPSSAFEASITGLPSGAAFDDSTWTVTWRTDLSDGGRTDLLLSVVSIDGRTDFPETALATIWLADAWDNPSNVPVTPLNYREEWGLPVVHVTTSGSISGSYSSVTVTYQGVEYPADIRIRGAVSASYPRPGYALRFPKTQLDVGLPDWHDKDHLILLTSFDDNSYVRQKFCFDIWREIADYWGTERLAPMSFFAVLYLNSAYNGLFEAVEKIDDELVDQLGLYRDGNLFKSIDHNANFYSTDVYGRTKRAMHMGYEKEEGLPASGPKAWTDLDDLVTFSATSSDDDFWAGAEDYIRVDEFMDWFLFVHFTEADDSGGKNAYLYDDNTLSMDFRYAPWDLHQSFGQDWMTLRQTADTYNDFTWTNGIFAHFQSQADASEAMWDRLDAMMTDGPLTEASLTSLLDSYYAEIDPSAARDWDKWASSYYTYGGWASYRDSYGDWTDYEGEKTYLYQWVRDREDWMTYYHPSSR
jgi:spore coat protein H